MPKPLRESITLLKVKRWWIKTAAEQLSCWISWSSYSQLFISFYHSFFHSLSLIAGDLDKNLAARWNILIWKASKKDGDPLATELLCFFQLPGNTDAIHCNPSSISQVSRPVLCKDGKHFRSWSSTQRVLSTQIAHVFVPSRYYTNMFIIHIYIYIYHVSCIICLLIILSLFHRSGVWCRVRGAWRTQSHHFTSPGPLLASAPKIQPISWCTVGQKKSSH